MRIYKNLWAGYETYFIRMGTSGQYATGINVVNVEGAWRVDFNGKYYASDLRHDKEHFPVVGSINIKQIIIDALIKVVVTDGADERT